MKYQVLIHCVDGDTELIHRTSDPKKSLRFLVINDHEGSSISVRTDTSIEIHNPDEVYKFLKREVKNEKNNRLG